MKHLYSIIYLMLISFSAVVQGQESSSALNSPYNYSLITTANFGITGIANEQQNYQYSQLAQDDSSLEETEIAVYPNPTRGRLNIETNKTITYSLYNILGKSVKLNGSIDNNAKASLDLSHLPNGIYVLKAKDERNNSKSFKIIKKE